MLWNTCQVVLSSITVYSLQEGTGIESSSLVEIAGVFSPGALVVLPPPVDMSGCCVASGMADRSERVPLGDENSSLDCVF